MIEGASGWDPLEEAGETDKELLSAAKKREIKNILKSYVSNYDPFSELLQNALDAVERRMQAGIGFDPKISRCGGRPLVTVNICEDWGGRRLAR